MQADKTQDKKRQSAENVVSKKRSGSRSGLRFVDNRPEAVTQRKLQELANNSPQSTRSRVIQRMVNNSGVIQLNAEWNKLRQNVREGTITIKISAKHIKGNKKIRRLVRSGGRRKASGPYSNQSQEKVLQNAIEAVKNGTARLIASLDTDFTIEVDSEHGVHGPRRFNIHKGGGGENTLYIHQISGDSSGYATPDDAEYSDSESEDGNDYFSDNEDEPSLTDEEIDRAIYEHEKWSDF